MRQPNGLIERVRFATRSCTWNCSSTSPPLCILKPEISCQDDANSSFGGLGGECRGCVRLRTEFRRNAVGLIFSGSFSGWLLSCNIDLDSVLP